MLENLCTSIPKRLLFKSMVNHPDSPGANTSPNVPNTRNRHIEGSFDEIKYLPPELIKHFSDPTTEYTINCTDTFDVQSEYFTQKPECQSALQKETVPLLDDDQAEVKIPTDWDALLNSQDWIAELQDKFDVLLSLQRIPKKLRPVYWKRIARVEEMKAQNPKFNYFEMRATPSAKDHEISKDVCRTMPDNQRFKTNIGTDRLFNILRAFAHFDPAIGYTQGMNFIVAVLLIYINPQNVDPSMKEYIILNDDYEHDAFWILVFMMQEKQWRTMFTDGIPLLFELKDRFTTALKLKMPELHDHIYSFDECTFDSCFASKFMTLFIYNAPLKLSVKIIDLFLYYGSPVLVSILLRILKFTEKKIMAIKDGEKLLWYLQNELLQTFHDEITFGELILPTFEPLQ